MHCGDPAHLCTRCLDEAFASKLRVAKVRGEAWADEIAASVACIEWLAESDGLATVARLKVIDLGRDPRLLERLARALLDAARARSLAGKSLTSSAHDRI
jgi:hypothetical protein